MDGKDELFQKLKPHCIAIAQSATNLKTTHVRQDDVVERLEKLQRIISATDSTVEDALDAKLADYVFFPLAQLLRESQKLSIRSLELCLQCIAVLVDRGWRQSLPPKLAAQMVILCTSLGEKRPKGFAFDESTDELQASSLWCLHHIFNEGAKSVETKKLLTDESSFPQLGQTISVILEGIRNSPSVEPQVAGTTALRSLVDQVLDVDIRASFLPGIVSSLTKIVSPQSRQRRNHKVLAGCLAIFETLLQSTMNDDLLDDRNADGKKRTTNTSVIDHKWQEDAASQLKPAIASVLRLKSHHHEDVRKSIAKLCIMLLRDCHGTLSNRVEIALEALIFIAANDEGSLIYDQVLYLMRYDYSMVQSLQNMMYSSLRNLPVVIQSSDEEVKGAKVNQITTMYRLLLAVDVNMTTLGRSLSAALRDCAVVTVGSSGDHQRATTVTNSTQPLSLALLDGRKSQFSIALSFASHSSHQKDMDHLASIVQLIGTSTFSREFTADLLRDLRLSSGQVQLANFWLLLNSVEAAVQEDNKADELLDFGEYGSETSRSDMLEEIYAFALSTLTEQSGSEQNPRMSALALRGLALRARTVGQDFRYELVDSLYPVLHTLATLDDQLQRESILTLDTFTAACGYTSTRDLIVENVDYLTNAVALKLNAFDVSPQAPQVLLMMVRLAGPSLLPYLEDTVDSIFAALEDYHGYPLLVELLFKVLSAMAEEGVKSPQLALTDGSSQPQAAESLSGKPTTIQGLVALLRHAASEQKLFSTPSKREPHLREPWKNHLNRVDAVDNEESEDAELDEMVGQPDPPPPAPKTYNLLFKITELTQHYLPSASPSLRTSLLSLIKTTVPAISQHENSFLPLINTLWPEIVSRLDDEEPYTVASAIEVVGLLCEYAGDFMRTRVEQVWPRLLEFRQRPISKTNPSVNQSKDGIIVKASGKGELTRSSTSVFLNSATNSHLISEALASALTKIIKYVRVSPSLADDALDMLAPVLENPEVRAAVESCNADALWLTQLKMGLVAAPAVPALDINPDWRFATIVV